MVHGSRVPISSIPQTFENLICTIGLCLHGARFASSAVFSDMGGHPFPSHIPGTVSLYTLLLGFYMFICYLQNAFFLFHLVFLSLSVQAGLLLACLSSCYKPEGRRLSSGHTCQSTSPHPFSLDNNQMQDNFPTQDSNSGMMTSL